MPASPDTSNKLIRRRVYYSGRVQGVGFRYTTREVASRFPVTGYVRNLADRRVELIAEGERGILDTFQAAVAQAMHGHIRETAIDETPATGQFNSFKIDH